MAFDDPDKSGRVRILIIAVLLWLVASTVWSGLLLYQTYQQTLSRTFLTDARALAALLAEHIAVTPGPATQPHTHLHDAQNIIQSDLDQAVRYIAPSKYVMVWSTDGEVIAHSNHQLRGTFLDTRRWPALEPQQSSRISNLSLQEGEITEITVPLEVSSEGAATTLAYISIGYPREELAAEFFQTLRPQIILCAIVIVAGALLNALVVQFVLHRLEKRRQEIQQTARARTSMLTERGMLASVLAHEVRSPLTALRFNLHALRTLIAQIGSTEENQRHIELTDRCEREIRRLDGMLNDFLQRTQVIGPPESTSVNAVITEALEFMRPALERKLVRVSLHLDASEPRVNVHPDELRQVILNLAANAQEAMPQGGTLAVSTITEESPAPAVTLLIRDSGVGIPQQLHQRIFEPFFSTKSGGSGLGLALVRRVVSGAGGTVSCESVEKQGTTFRITLPRMETSAPTGQGYVMPNPDAAPAPQ